MNSFSFPFSFALSPTSDFYFFCFSLFSSSPMASSASWSLKEKFFEEGKEFEEEIEEIEGSKKRRRKRKSWAMGLALKVWMRSRFKRAHCCFTARFKSKNGNSNFCFSIGSAPDNAQIAFPKSKHQWLWPAFPYRQVQSGREVPYVLRPSSPSLAPGCADFELQATLPTTEILEKKLFCRSKKFRCHSKVLEGRVG